MKLVRYLASSVMLLFVLGLLAACGSAAESPEVRSENFLKEFAAAVNNPDLAKPEVEDAAAEKLSKFFVPDQQASQKTAILKQLDDIVPMAGKVSAKLENVKFEKVSEEGDTAVIKAVSGALVMTIDGDSHSLDLVDGGVSGGSGDQTTMKKVDNVWYIVP